MDCAICFGEITETTGRTQLSCKHEFHLKCVVTWLQREEGAGTCPCCRAEPGEMERIGASEDSESEGSVTSEESDVVEGVTPLMLAAEANNVDEIRRLVAGGASLEAVDSDKDTALVYAVRNRRVAATDVLIELGADVQAVAILCPDNEDEELTPEFALHGACMWANAPCIRYLLDSGVDPNCCCAGDGVPPLTTVIRSGEEEEDMEEAIELLMKKGANPFKTDPTRWNTFMWFAEYGLESPYIMRLLVPPGPTDAMATAAARLIQTTWRWRQQERNCARILTGLKFTIVNEAATAATATAIEDTWFMARMLRVD